MKENNVKKMYAMKYAATAFALQNNSVQLREKENLNEEVKKAKIIKF